MSRENRYRYWVLSGLLVVFGAVFWVRGPVRALDGGADLVHLYAASALWVDGGNPYDGTQCVERMEEAGYHNPNHVANGSFYPPPTIAVLAPLGLLDWDTAKRFWLVLNLLACAALIWSLANWVDGSDRLQRGLIASVIVLAWGPVATAMSLGQLALVSPACLFVGLVLLDRGKAWPAGVLIGLGCLIKPQLGLGFLLLVAMRKEWVAIAWGAGLIVVVSAVGIGRLMMTAPDWAQHLAGNITSDRASGNVLDASPAGPMRYQMIDLHPLLHHVLPGAWVGTAALLVVGLLAAAALWRLLQMGLALHSLLAISGVGLLLLMPVYHRFYDAVLLLPLLALTCNVLVKSPRDRLMWVIAFAMLLLVFPLPAMLATFTSRGLVPEAIAGSSLWGVFVMQCQSWALLIAAFALVAWTWSLSAKKDTLTVANLRG